MAFEKYTGARRTSRGPMVTIRKTGQISFNAAAASDMKLVEKPAVVLFYDKDTKVIGIKGEPNTKSDGARKLGKVGRTRTIAASSFINFFDINLARNLRIVPAFDKKKDMIILDLKKATKVTPRPRKKK